jgi:hypothetical protein
LALNLTALGLRLRLHAAAAFEASGLFGYANRGQGIVIMMNNDDGSILMDEIAKNFGMSFGSE